MRNYAKHVYGATPQTEKVHGVDRQAKNNAGGVSFTLDKWDYLMRFLVLGTEGGTYYVNERKLTVDAARSVSECLSEDGKRAVDTIVEVSYGGRAANNDAAIFALAMACSHPNDATRTYALQHVGDVCRIGTHLFHFIDFAKQMRGMGPGLRKALARWYTGKDIDKLAYQMLKYQQRDGWANRDILRLCHAVPKTPEQNELFAYAVGKRDTVPTVSPYTTGIARLNTGEIDAVGAIREYGLTREVLPTDSLNRVEVWEALLEKMPMGALVRNLGKMASLDMHKPMSDTEAATVTKLTNETAIKKSRLHPIGIMNAKAVYDRGRGLKGKLSWKTNANVSGALEDAFYKSFNYVEPSGKRIMLAVDVSGSMTWDNPGGGALNCLEAATVLAMTTVRTEPRTFITAFSSGTGGYDTRGERGGISEMNITARDSLKAALNEVNKQ